MGSYSLSGTTTATYDIAGDESFALGRWAYGTIKYDAITLDETFRADSNLDYRHYVVFNRLTSLPATTTVTTCDTGVFTTPTLFSTSPGISGLPTAATTGSVSLAFSGGVGTIDISLLSTSEGVSNTVSATGISLSSVSTIAQVGSMPGGSGAWVTVADGGGGSYRVVGVYSTVLPNGLGYRGVYTFKCTPV